MNSLTALIIEDDLLNSQMTKDLLQYKSIQSFIAHDLDKALEILEIRAINLIITDYTMPRMSGCEFLRNLPEKFRDIPVIFVSGSHDPEKKNEAKSLGAIDYLEKPVSPIKLFAAISKIENKLSVCEQ